MRLVGYRGLEQTCCRGRTAVGVSRCSHRFIGSQLLKHSESYCRS